MNARWSLFPALLLVLTLLAQGCATPCATGGGEPGCCSRFGDLSGDDLRELERYRWRNRSRWRLYTGVAGMTVGLVGTALGTAYVVRSNQRSADADAAIASDRKLSDQLRDQSEGFKTVGIVALAVGAPLVIAGLTLMIVDLAERAPVDDAPPKTGASSLTVTPFLTADGPASSGGLVLQGRF